MADFNVFYECADGDRTTHADNDVLSATLAQLDVLVGCAAAERRWLRDGRVGWADGFLLSGMTAGGGGAGGGGGGGASRGPGAGSDGRGRPGRRAWRLTPRLPLSQAHGRHHQITPATRWDPGRLVVSAPGAKALVLSPLEFAPPPTAAANVSAAAATEWCELRFVGGAVLQLGQQEEEWRALRNQSSGGGGRTMQRSAAPFGLWIVQSADATMPRVVCPGGWAGVWPVAES